MDYAVLGYTGAYRDAVTGGYPLGNGYRVHLPALMRFAAPDSWSPFGRGGVNPYNYCGGDPINRSDPSGHAFGALEQYAAHLAESTIKDAAREASSLAAENARAAAAVAKETAGSSLLRERSDSESSGDSMSGFGLVNLAPKTWKPDIFMDGSQYVHGTNSTALEGIANSEALLTVEELHKTEWFRRNGNELRSGELYQSDPGKPFLKKINSTTVSLYTSPHADLAAGIYGRYGTGGEVFPIVIGVRSSARPFPIEDHYMTEGSINIQHFAAIYVPNNRVEDAKRLLLQYGSPRLSALVKSSSVFDPMAL